MVKFRKHPNRFILVWICKRGNQMNPTEIYEKAIEIYGENAQLDMAVEEMSELTKEICKRKRGKDNHAAIVEEVADVLIMIEQLKIMCQIGSKELNDVKWDKIKCLEERLKMGINYDFVN